MDAFQRSGGMWKRFNFFEKKTMSNDTAVFPERATCCTSGKDMIFFGCDTGEVCSIDEEYHTKIFFQAHERICNVVTLKKRKLVMTLGYDGNDLTIKIWDVERLLRTIKVDSQGARVTAFDVFEEEKTQIVALGLSTGCVVILRGDVVRDKATRLKLTLSPDDPVTGLALSKEGDSVILFATTESRTQGYNLGPAGSTWQPAKMFEDPEGANMNCSVITSDGTLAVGRTEAVFIYSVDGRGPCFVFEGEKQLLFKFKKYLLSISNRTGSDRKLLTVYDLKNKLIAFSGDVEETPFIVYQWNTLHVLMKQQQSQSFVLKEKSMSSKIEILFRKNLYNVALQLAQDESDNKNLIADIHRRYGDHLYHKQDYDNAMQQYILTIGEVEPSYVIRKFLDAQRIPNLASYLESLHHHGMANADHTTLLLNCYTKIKDVTKLDAFIHVDSSVQPEDYIKKFDVETAIKVCRSSGYYEHALYVAEHAMESSWYLRILLEDCQRYEDALHYLSNLKVSDAVEAIKKYGKMLVTSRPEETTALLMRLSTPSTEENSSGIPAKPADFVHLFADQPRALMVFCEYILNSSTEPQSEDTLYITLLELYLTAKLGDGVNPMAPSKPVWQMSPVGEKKVVDTDVTSAEYNERLSKALTLLKNGWPTGSTPKYDAEHALMICHVQSFKKGVIFLLERMKMYRDVLKVYMDSNDCQGLVEAVMRLGDESYGGDARLWSDVLQFFGQYEGDCSNEVKKILEHIEKRNLLPPVIVLQILSKNTYLTLSVVKEYIARVLKAESNIIEEDKRAVQKYRREAVSMQKELHELKTQARVFQNSKCSACSAPLELPAIHFLCMHSYHSRCLGENERECPICTPQNYTILDMRRSQRASLAEPDKFFTQLQHSADGFAVVAEYFGRGLMNM